MELLFVARKVSIEGLCPHVAFVVDGLTLGQREVVVRGVLRDGQCRLTESDEAKSGTCY